MKIVIASDAYWPAMNGCSVASKSVADGMAALGHEVIVLAPSQNKRRLHIENDGLVKIYRLTSRNFPFYHNQVTPPPKLRRLSPKLYKDGFRVCVSPYKEIVKVLDKFKPDMIHVEAPIMIGVSTNKYAVKNNIPCVITNHFLPENMVDNVRALAPVSKPVSETIKLYEKGFLKKFDYITMPTQMAVDLFWKANKRKMGVPPIEPVSNGIDLASFRPGKVPESFYAKYGIPKDVPIITYLGRIDGEKHIEILMEAYAKIAKKTKSCLILVGCGNNEDNLKLLAKELGIEGTTIFTGKIIGKDKELVHRVGTVFCMPSPVELQSLSMLEAMACGQPVVAVDAGALGELCINKLNGFLCEKDNVQEIAKSLQQILLNPELRARFSEESLAIAKKHDIKASLKRYEEIYRKVIEIKKQEIKVENP